MTVLFCLYSCEKKEFKAKDNHRTGLLQSLNEGDNDTVISNLENRSQNDNQDKFLLASAYASKGGIDIYAMFPLLEVKLFHEKAINWGSSNDTNKKYTQILEKRSNNENETPEDREQRWMSSEKFLMEKYIKVPKPDCSHYEDDSDTCEVYLTSIKEYITELKAKHNILTYDHYDYKKLDILFNNVLGYEFYGADFSGNWESYNRLANIKYDVEKYTEYLYEYEVEKSKFIHPPKIAGAKEEDIPLIMMNILWTTYEAIPLLESLPQIPDSNQKYITKSIDELALLAKDPKMKGKASTFLYELSIFSLISIYSSSFDFSKVNSPQDLYCQFKPEKIANNYSIIKKRIDVLLRHGKDSFLPADQRENFEQNYEKFKNLPDALSDDKKNGFIEHIISDQKESCSASSLL
ncbi:MAG: hypothetical protein N4A33_02510 [Bacteriovoracaceae bacterium]|nr:hypothetical protein [Bacteriovoracaceae bacterium]